MTPKTAIILFGCALLTGTGVIFGATGEYQQARDSKTTVWNPSPKRGESAAWAGSRDKEGYATGFGTITWYNASGTEDAVYYGNMVNGKLEGPVNLHKGRQIAHAYFADGSRATTWARGPAPSKMNVPDELVAKRLKAESAQPKPRDERAEVKSETTVKRDQPAETARPVEQPKKPVIAETRPRATPAEGRIEAPTPEPSIAEANPPALAETTPNLPTPEPTQSIASSFETTPLPTIEEAPAAVVAEETPQVSTPEPSIEQRPTTVEPSAAPVEAEKKSEDDGSISSLTGPPSSLRNESKPSGTRGIAQLTEDDAVGLADAEARDKGYDVNAYLRPKADYSAVKDKWSLFYTLKDPKAGAGELQPFSATVEDKTKKVEVRKNY
jgi:hypothetical protein